MDKVELKEVIRSAFRGVKLEHGVGLWEGQAIDDYETEDVIKQQREKDEKDDWSKITVRDMNDCQTSLSFFDTQGMRFHLPAFMIAEIDGLLCDNQISFYLTRISDIKKFQFYSLSKGQRNAVVKFLEWCLEQDQYHEYDREDINKALDEYWKVE